MTALSVVARPTKLFGRRSNIPVNSEYLWRIESGYVRTLTWSDLGKVTALGLWGPGDVVGRSLSCMTPLSVECLCQVQATQLPYHTECTERELYDRLHQHEFMQFMMVDSSTEGRLLKFFYWLAQRYGQLHNGRAQLPVKLTHQDLAEFVGSTRVTVTRLLGQLERKGVIQWGDRRRMVVQSDVNFLQSS